MIVIAPPSQKPIRTQLTQSKLNHQDEIFTVGLSWFREIRVGSMHLIFESLSVNVVIKVLPAQKNAEFQNLRIEV